MAELADLSRQINGQLDTRLVQLEILLHEADDKIARLEAATHQGACGDEVQAAESELSEQRAEAEEMLSRLRGEGRSSLRDVASRSKNASKETVPSESQEPTEENSENPEHRNIFALSDSGQSAIQIAQQLGRPTGEIELILSLRKDR